MSEEKKEAAEAAAEETTEPAKEATKPAEARPRRSLGPVIVLLVIAVAVAFWFLAPEQIKERLRSALPDIRQATQQLPETAKTAPPPARPAKEELPPPLQPVEEKLSPEPARPAASSEEVEALLNSIEALQQDIESLRDEQRSVHELQRQMQQMHLRTRLGWIIEPASRLPQIHLTWKEISLLPFLSEDERNRANEMRALAAQRLQDIHTWQQQIRTWAEKLVVSSYDDIIPGSDNPWLDWVAKQFHLRRAPSAEEKDLIRMRNRLLKIGRMMNLEQWPARGEWQLLRAELQLKLAAIQGQPDQAVELGLPDDFSAIAQDIERLRENARDWLEAL